MSRWRRLCDSRPKPRATKVEFATAGMDQRLFVSRYLVALPSAEKYRIFPESDRERIESLMQQMQPSAMKRAIRKPRNQLSRSKHI